MTVKIVSFVKWIWCTFRLRSSLIRQLFIYAAPSSAFIQTSETLLQRIWSVYSPYESHVIFRRNFSIGKSKITDANRFLPLGRHIGLIAIENLFHIQNLLLEKNPQLFDQLIFKIRWNSARKSILLKKPVTLLVSIEISENRG